MQQLDGITVGMTTVVRGHAVTRHARDRFEVGTLGRAGVNAFRAAKKIAFAE